MYTNTNEYEDSTVVDEAPFKSVTYQNSKDLLNISILSESQYDQAVKNKKLY